MTEAKALAEQSLADIQSNADVLPEHLALSQISLGNVLMELRQFDDAIQQYQSAHALYLQEWPADHPKVALSAHNLATAHRQNNQCDLAIPLYELAIEANTKRLGADHSRVKASRAQWSLCQRTEAN